MGNTCGGEEPPKDIIKPENLQKPEEFPKKKNEILEEEIELPESDIPTEKTALPIENFPNLIPKVLEIDQILPAFQVEKDPEDVDLPSLGPYVLSNSEIYYEGQWKLGYRQGFGKQIFTDGSYYVGNFKEDDPHGSGRLIYNNGDYYEGEWKYGYGIYKIYGTVSKYEGSWWCDLQHGFGKETFKDNSRFEGVYSKGEKKGKGKYFWSDGSLYIGDFEKNTFHGQGHLICPEIQEEQYNPREKKMTIKEKESFEFKGNFFNGVKQGPGEFFWKNGKRYLTEWENGLQVGTAIYVFPNGKKREELWEKGKRVKVVYDEIEYDPMEFSQMKGIYKSKRMAVS